MDAHKCDRCGNYYDRNNRFRVKPKTNTKRYVSDISSEIDISDSSIPQGSLDFLTGMNFTTEAGKRTLKCELCDSCIDLVRKLLMHPDSELIVPNPVTVSFDVSGLENAGILVGVTSDVLKDVDYLNVVEGKVTLDLNNYPDGMYLVVVITPKTGYGFNTPPVILGYPDMEYYDVSNTYRSVIPVSEDITLVLGGVATEKQTDTPDVPENQGITLEYDSDGLKNAKFLVLDLNARDENDMDYLLIASSDGVKLQPHVTTEDGNVDIRIEVLPDAGYIFKESSPPTVDNLPMVSASEVGGEDKYILNFSLLRDTILKISGIAEKKGVDVNEQQ